jgi:hypothetical protein
LEKRKIEIGDITRPHPERGKICNPFRGEPSKKVHGTIPSPGGEKGANLESNRLLKIGEALLPRSTRERGRREVEGPSGIHLETQGVEDLQSPGSKRFFDGGGGAEKENGIPRFQRARENLGETVQGSSESW